jgi:hypothetical protein
MNKILLTGLIIFLVVVSFWMGLCVNLTKNIDQLKESETTDKDFIKLKSIEYTNSIQSDYYISMMVDDFYLERFGYYEGIIHRDYDMYNYEGSMLLPKNKSIDFFIRNGYNTERLSLTFN